MKLLWLACLALSAQTLRVSGNFPADLYGSEDNRPACWGRAESAELPIKFNPPEGMKVRILRIRGDLLSWPRVLASQPPVLPGRYAGVLVGFSTTGAQGSKRR